MNIQVDDMKCCMCQAALLEKSSHLFVECEYVVKVRDTLVQLSKILATLELIKLKHWRRLKKITDSCCFGSNGISNTESKESETVSFFGLGRPC